MDLGLAGKVAIVAGAMSFVNSPPAPETPGVQTLSNYCSAKGTPPDTDLGSRWRLEITVVDLNNKTVVVNRYFWGHQ